MREILRLSFYGRSKARNSELDYKNIDWQLTQSSLDYGIKKIVKIII